MREASAREYPRGRMAVRRFGGGWHTHCGECDEFVCLRCTGPAKLSHSDAVVLTLLHIKKVHS